MRISMKYRLKDRELQRQLDSLTNKDFSKWLNDAASDAFDCLNMDEYKDELDDIAFIQYHDVVSGVNLKISFDVRKVVELEE